MRIAFRKEWLLYAAAAAALAFSMAAVTKSQPEVERLAPQGPISTAPFDDAIAATGVVEPSSRTIVVAPDIEGVVKSVFVAPGDDVEAHAPLFALDERRHIAVARQAAARVARAEAEIAFRQAEQRARAADADAARVAAARLRTSVERYRPIAAEAMSAEEFDKLTADAETAAFRFRAAQQNARAAAAAIDTAAEEAELARAELAGAEAELSRTIMRSPIAGSVLSVDVSVGEAVRPSDRAPASISVGAIDTLIARVEIDETEAAHFNPDAEAKAFLRGQNTAPIALRFQSLDPILKPKTAFRNAAAEYADARVLEARYVVEGAPPLYVGQLLDVYINASPSDVRSPKIAEPRAATPALGVSTVGFDQQSTHEASDSELRP